MTEKIVCFICLFTGLLALQCGNDDNSGTGDSDSDTDGDTDSDTDTDTDTDSDTDIDTDELNWWLHDDVEALVYVSWPQSSPGTVHVEYQVDGVWRSTPAFDAEPGYNEQLIVGIPYETDAEWRVVQEGGDSESGPTITTGPIPSELLEPTVTVSLEDQWLKDGNFFLNSINVDTDNWESGDVFTYIVDRNGRFVWAQKTPLENWTLFAQVAQSGDHILWDEATYWSSWDHGENSVVHATYLDAEIEVISTPGLHHAFVQLPDGTLALGSQFHGGGEALAERAPGSSTVDIIWTVEDDWPEGDSTQGHPESNCLYYHPSTNTYLYSWYTNDSVVEIDRATGESLWWAGNAAGGYGFSPSNSQYDWQHGVSYTNDDTLLVSTRAGSQGDWYTPVREYNVNHKTNTLELIWEYNPGEYARYNGDAWRLSNGNTLHVVGSGGDVVEVTQDGTEVWRLEFPYDRLLGRGELIEDLYDLITPRK